MVGVDESENCQKFFKKRKRETGRLLRWREEGTGEETLRVGGLPQYGLVQLHSGEREDGVRKERREERMKVGGGRGG